MQVSLLAKNLRFLRNKKGWQQSEMLDRCGVKQRNWSNWENSISEPDVTNLIAISKLFGVSIDQLLTVEIEINGNLIENEADKKNEENRNLNRNLNGNLNQKKEKKTEKEEQTDLLILKQLNYLTDKIDKMDKKLDRKGN